MTQQQLRAVVTEMEAELARAEGLDQGARRSLEQLVHDLNTLLERPGQVEAADQQAHQQESLRDRLADRARGLEASHPTLSTTLGNVIDTLAFFGL